MKIGIAGYGVVGKAMAEFFRTPFIYDPKYIGYGFDNIKNCNMVVVCVPTNQKEDGSADTSIVEEIIATVSCDVFLIKSTVPPGTTEILSKKYKKRIVFSPEYLSESNYYSPYSWKPVEEPFVIVGGEPKDRKFVLDVIQPIMGPYKRYIQMSYTEAEIVKYMENSWFAAQVAFCNEFYNICELFSADYNTVREGWAADPRVIPTHSLVFSNNRGFGGKCLPKDTSAIVKASSDNRYVPIMLSSIIKSNKEMRKE